jgi:O-antigen ligase
MNSIYTLLFALSIVVINPWGLSRGEIWTFPKVLILILLTIFNLSIVWEERKSFKIPRNWFVSLALWLVFLGIGFLSTQLSPFSDRSLLGQNEMGTGWLYWLVLGIFTLSNTLLLKLQPALLRSQLFGFLIGGIILALSIFPQTLDWRIDYTATMGQLLKDNVLTSTIFQNHQPIGFYSHRGHAAFVLAVVSVLYLVAWRWKWIATSAFALCLTPIILALFLTKTRAGILVLFVATAYLLGKKYSKFLIPAALICLLFVGAVTTTRSIAGLPLIKQITSDRVYLWQLAGRGISQRPWFGWGFDGFGIAYPYTLSPKKTPQIVRLGSFSFDYQQADGRIGTRNIISHKAHNLILDTAVSVGILGTLFYVALWAWNLWQTIKSPARGIEAAVIAYLVFTFTWFECAQFSHIAWWVLSLWGASSLPWSKGATKVETDAKAETRLLEETRFLNWKKWQKFLLLWLVSILVISPLTFYYLTHVNYPKNAFFSNSKQCGSPSSGPTDNPIATFYGKSAYPWTDEIRWNCVYNINDFPQGNLLDRYNAARDAALAYGGGVVYFPAGIYQFPDSIYLKDSVVIRGETPRITSAQESDYAPPTKLVFPKYEPKLSGSGTSNSTAFKKIFTTSPNSDRNIGLVNLDIDRAGIYLLGNIDSHQNRNIIIHGIRNNNVADPSPKVPQQDFQEPWMRYSYPFAANIKINAYANVLVSNNRLNDSPTDNYDQPNYKVRSLDLDPIATYVDGSQVPFNYLNHYGIVINRAKRPGTELDFALAADPISEPGLFRRGIVIRDNWIYHEMRAGIRASGDGLVIQDNQIRDLAIKQAWTDAEGIGQPRGQITFENRAIDWSGWNVLIQGNDYQVYRHQLMDSSDYSVDGEGILIQECCGGTSVKGVVIRENRGNSYIGLYKTPSVRDVLIAENELLTNVTNTPLIYVNADTNSNINSMDDVRIENNQVNGSILAKASLPGDGNMVSNNQGLGSGSIQHSCHVKVKDNTGFEIAPCLQSEN